MQAYADVKNGVAPQHHGAKQKRSSATDNNEDDAHIDPPSQVANAQGCQVKTEQRMGMFGPPHIFEEEEQRKPSKSEVTSVNLGGHRFPGRSTIS